MRIGGAYSDPLGGLPRPSPLPIIPMSGEAEAALPRGNSPRNSRTKVASQDTGPSRFRLGPFSTTQSCPCLRKPILNFVKTFSACGSFEPFRATEFLQASPLLRGIASRPAAIHRPISRGEVLPFRTHPKQAVHVES